MNLGSNYRGVWMQTVGVIAALVLSGFALGFALRSCL